MKRLALLLLLIAAAQGAFAETFRSYHDSIAEVENRRLIFEFPDSGVFTEAIEIEASLPDVELGSPLIACSLLWNLSSDGKSFYRATLRPVNPMPDEIPDCRAVVFSISCVVDGRDSLIMEEKYRDRFALGRGVNTLGVEIDREARMATVYGGDSGKNPEILADVAVDAAPCPRVAVEAQGKAKLRLLVTEYSTHGAPSVPQLFDAVSLATRLDGCQAPAGYYRYLDCDVEEAYAGLGGNYSLALVPATDGGFDVIYLAGAQRNSSGWSTGMLKGHLTPTIFQNHYDLTWYDSEKRPLAGECSANIDQNALLTLSFPMFKSQLRFALTPVNR